MRWRVTTRTYFTKIEYCEYKLNIRLNGEWVTQSVRTSFCNSIRRSFIDSIATFFLKRVRFACSRFLSLLFSILSSRRYPSTESINALPPVFLPRPAGTPLDIFRTGYLVLFSERFTCLVIISNQGPGSKLTFNVEHEDRF